MKKFFKLIARQHISKFEVNSRNLDLIVQCFYGILTIAWYSPYLQRIIKNWEQTVTDLNTRTSDSWLWPVQWINFIPEKPLVVLCLVTGGFILSVICTVFPHKRWLRILVFLFSFQSLALLYSPVKIDHSRHVVLIISFWFIFINLNKKKYSTKIKEQNKFYLWATQISFLGTYCLSGLWKLREFINSLMQMDWSEIQCLERNFALIYTYENINSPFYMETLKFLDGRYINHLLWMGVIAFQISTPLASWFPSIQRFYGLLIILFHISTAIFMNIYFHLFQYVALIILVCHPYQRKIIKS